MTSQYSRYTPFDKNLYDVLPEELSVLKEVHEGWYVEYKSEMPRNRDIAKSLSAFANQYGGILFIGISTEGSSNVASKFPGILNASVDGALEELRNSSKDQLNPSVFFDTRIFEGPIGSIGLHNGRSIVAVRIPQGPDTPYVHNNGRIYRRVADASDPSPETDRTTLDMLHDRRRQTHSHLERRILHTPVVSKGEDDQPFMHFNILSDPYEIMGHWYSGGMHQFNEVMRGGIIPFDNVFASSEGFIARQIGINNPLNRLLTWEFSRHCHSFVTVPINVITRSGDHSSSLESFLSRLDESGLEYARVLDLNQVMAMTTGVMIRHRRLARQANVNGPFYVKIHLENVWRTVPFIDIENFFQYTSEFGFPLVQHNEELVPLGGVSLDRFIHLSERDISSEINAGENVIHGDMYGIFDDAAALGIRILMALGISLDLTSDIMRSFMGGMQFSGSSK